MISISQKRFALPIVRNRTEVHGFTLIELLVVVAIISLLVAILVPSLSKAKDLARSVVCMSNERSLGLAFAQYAADYNGSFPTTGGLTNNTAHWYNTWVNLLSEPYMETGAWDGGPGPRFNDHAPNAFRGLKQPSIWLCPSATPWAYDDGTYIGPSYGVNRHLTGWYSSSRKMTPYKIEELKEPQKTPLLFDCEGVFHAYPQHLIEYGASGHFAHFDKGGDNMLFADGHVEWIPPLEDDPTNPVATMETYRDAAEYFVQDSALWE